MDTVNWQWLSFDALSRDQLYAVLKVRQAVFAVEQNCVYQDVDDLDQVAWHLLGWHRGSPARDLAAYLRVVFPGEKYPEPSIGRVLTAPQARGTGIGKALMREAITRTMSEYGPRAIRISAQQHLESYYAQFGFETVSEPYDEDGIPHVEMLRTE